MKNLILILTLFALMNCAGYEPIFSKKELNYYVERVNVSKDDKISKKFIEKLKIYRVEDYSKKPFIVSINSSKNKSILSKDKKGNDSTYRIKITFNFQIFEKENLLLKINLQESFDYNNQDNKYNLSVYEDQIVENLIDQVFEKLIIALQKIR